MPSARGKPKASLAKMAKDRFGILMILLPQTPFIIRLTLSHLLKRSESSKYLDLWSVVLVQVLHRILDPPPGKTLTVSKLQATTTREPGVKGRMWISQVVSITPPETSIRDVLLYAIESMNEELVSKDKKSRIPEILPVQAEWTAHRENATRKSPLPTISEEEIYTRMLEECKSLITILYFHGGAYYLCDPATHRAGVKKMAKLIGGRVYSVRYRLAPQYPFPSALLDALVSYFTLLYPPPGAVHEAVAPGHIVFGGDSAGGNLSLALLQTLLQIRRHKLKITWFGQERQVPLPAGVTALSPWLDMVQSLPSWMTNQKWDYLPPPNVLDQADVPACALWPASPPRRHIFVDDDFLLHPLASLHLASSWAGAPPVYLTCGWECLADEDRYLAQKLHKDGVPVVFEEYEAMPHVFAFILTDRPEARRCLDGLVNFIKATVDTPAGTDSAFTTVKARSMKEVDIDVDSLSPYSRDDLKRLAYAAVGTSSMPSAPMASAKL